MIVDIFYDTNSTLHFTNTSGAILFISQMKVCFSLIEIVMILFLIMKKKVDNKLCRVLEELRTKLRYDSTICLLYTSDAADE